MKRVMIVGGPGSGKSTLARRLGAATGLPVVHLDALYWSPGWVESDPAAFDARARDAAAGERWIIEGNYSRTFPERVARADMLVFLDVATPLRLWRVLRRTLRHLGRDRPDLAPGCPERLDRAFLRYVLDYRRTGRPKALALLEGAPHGVPTAHLRTRAAVRAFLRRAASPRAEIDL